MVLCIARIQSACSRTTRAAGITSWQAGPRTPLRRSSAVGSGCTRAYPVNQHRCSRRGPCAEPPLWDAPRPGSLLAGIRWLFLATLFCEMWLTPSAAFVGRASADQTSARSVHGTRHEHTDPGTQLHLGHDDCALSIVRALAVARWASPPVEAPGGGVMDAAPGSPGGRTLRLAAFACSYLATAGPEHHRSLTNRARGRISGGSGPVPWQAPATQHQQRGRSREQPSEHVAHKHQTSKTGGAGRRPQDVVRGH
jgi:hypothetical protein